MPVGGSLGNIISVDPHLKRAFRWYVHNVLVKYPGWLIVISVTATFILGRCTQFKAPIQI